MRRLKETIGWNRLKRYPELALLGFSLAAFSIGLVLHLPVSVPNGSFGAAILQHYVLPLSIAAMVNLAILFRSRSNRESSAIVLGLSIPTLAVATYCHFECKVWMPLIHPHRFGAFYESVDRYFSPVVALCGRWVGWMEHAGIDVSTAYHGWFMLLFFVCFGLHAFYDSAAGQRQLILGVGWILALGGVAYWITPAVGPFIYRNGADSAATVIQHVMWQKYQLLVLTQRLPVSYFLMPPAAMPSLHVAHAAFLIWMLRRISPKLTLSFLPVLLWFMVTAVGLAWHYILDIPAGFLLAAVAVVLVTHLVPDAAGSRSRAPAKEDVAGGVLVPVQSTMPSTLPAPTVSFE